MPADMGAIVAVALTGHKKRQPELPFFDLRLPRGGLLAGGLAGVLLTEFLDAAGRVDDLLFARVERMTVRAHLDLQVMPERGARLERVPAAAGDGDLFVFGMDAGFHA